MEKTLTIDDKQVKFKSRGSTPLRYKAQFHRDFLVDIMSMEGLAKLGKNPSLEKMKSLDTEVFYNICWVLAKTADKEIPEPMEWLDEFDSFPLMEIIPELQDLITSSLTSKKK
ncbi:hypothetical protein FZC79_10485 [Rossellomorea vietnamensis]|uniref:Uncharacterized protein n=1 Tax=Rossellomorea vietnamensis TaxID=218284 RepID=A0A5D4KFT0_9BACI|nr:hypothetical protein [Rossellomorea vietnamensis]TYR75585.1 hypothetical protein FZC79_10485 [Rossellomorea vietnamensis]